MSLKKSHGFTLLEILVALFIFAIASMIMMSALHNIINTQSATEKRSERFGELQLALMIFSHDANQVINRPITNGANNQEGFLGTKNILVFTHGGLINPFGEDTRTTLQRVRYQFEKNQLVRITWPVLDRTTNTPEDRHVLLKSVKSLKFEYLDSNGKFQQNWPLQNQEPTSPRGIRITLTLNDLGTITQFYVIPEQPSEKPEKPEKPATT